MATALPRVTTGNTGSNSGSSRRNSWEGSSGAATNGGKARPPNLHTRSSSSVYEGDDDDGDEGELSGCES